MSLLNPATVRVHSSSVDRCKWAFKVAHVGGIRTCDVCQRSGRDSLGIARLSLSSFQPSVPGGSMLDQRRSISTSSRSIVPENSVLCTTTGRHADAQAAAGLRCAHEGGIAHLELENVDVIACGQQTSAVVSASDEPGVPNGSDASGATSAAESKPALDLEFPEAPVYVGEFGRVIARNVCVRSSGPHYISISRAVHVRSLVDGNRFEQCVVEQHVPGQRPVVGERIVWNWERCEYVLKQEQVEGFEVLQLGPATQ